MKLILVILITVNAFAVHEVSDETGGLERYRVNNTVTLENKYFDWEKWEETVKQSRAMPMPPYDSVWMLDAGIGVDDTVQYASIQLTPDTIVLSVDTVIDTVYDTVYVEDTAELAALQNFVDSLENELRYCDDMILSYDVDSMVEANSGDSVVWGKGMVIHKNDKKKGVLCIYIYLILVVAILIVVIIKLSGRQ